MVEINSGNFVLANVVVLSFASFSIWSKVIESIQTNCECGTLICLSRIFWKRRTMKLNEKKKRTCRSRYKLSDVWLWVLKVQISPNFDSNLWTSFDVGHRIALWACQKHKCDEFQILRRRVTILIIICMKINGFFYKLTGFGIVIEC